MYIMRMVEVITTDEFAVWYDELNTADTEAVTRVVGLLEARGGSRWASRTAATSRGAATPYASCGCNPKDGRCASCMRLTPSGKRSSSSVPTKPA